MSKHRKHRIKRHDLCATIYCFNLHVNLYKSHILYILCIYGTNFFSQHYPLEIYPDCCMQLWSVHFFLLLYHLALCQHTILYYYVFLLLFVEICSRHFTIINFVTVINLLPISRYPMAERPGKAFLSLTLTHIVNDYSKYL